MSELVQALQGHVQRQTQVAETANQNLERLIESLATLPAVLQAQQQQIARMQGQLDSQPSAQKVQELLTQVSGIRDAVRESSASLARHTETAQRTGEALAAELRQQGQSVAQIAQSTDPMMRAISALRSDVGARGEELAQCVTSLNSKLVQFAATALVLALIAAIAALAALLR
jgi:chromosome segregation ATPase